MKLKHENIIEMIDAFETPQEFCVVTEFAQVHKNSVWVPCPFSSLTGFNCLELANFSENACLRENCLRCSRMINAFQKNKFRLLLSSWYALSSSRAIAVQLFWPTSLHGFSTFHYRWKHCITCIPIELFTGIWNLRTSLSGKDLL